MAAENALNLLLGGDCVPVCWSSRQLIRLLSLSRVLKDRATVLTQILPAAVLIISPAALFWGLSLCLSVWFFLPHVQVKKQRSKRIKYSHSAEGPDHAELVRAVSFD